MREQVGDGRARGEIDGVRDLPRKITKHAEGEDRDAHQELLSGTGRTDCRSSDLWTGGGRERSFPRRENRRLTAARGADARQ